MSTREEHGIMETSAYAAIGKIPADAQVTVKDTGWSERQKEEMRTHGFDDMDMVREWYS